MVSQYDGGPGLPQLLLNASVLPTVAARLPASCSPPLLVGALALVVALLWHFAGDGFAPDGKFPTLLALLHALGTNLVILVPQAPPKVTEGLVPVRAARPNGGSVGEPHAATLLTSILDIQVRQGVSQPNADN
jgi:hypothetical protein